MKKLILILVVSVAVLFNDITFAGETNSIEILKRGCGKWENISILKNKDTSNKSGIYLFGYCKGINEGLSTKYGQAKSTFSVLTHGIGQNIEFSYNTFCMTYETLLQKLSDDELRKLVLTLSTPIITKEKNLYPIFYILDNMPNLSTPFIFSLDINFYKNVEKQDRYNILFKSLFTADSDTAYTQIITMPDALIPQVDTLCNEIKAIELNPNGGVK